MIYKKLFILIIGLASINFLIMAQSLTIKTYTEADGVPSKVIFDVIQDSTGLLYFSSVNKIFTYDGLAWNTIYENKSGDEVSYIKILFDSHNKLWALPANLDQSILSIDKKSVYKLPPINNYENVKINFTSIAVDYPDNSPVLYAGATNGLFIYKNSKWSKTGNSSLDGDSIINISFYKDTLFVSTAHKIFKSDGSEIETIYNSGNSTILTHSLEIRNDSLIKVWALLDTKLGYIQNNSFKVFAENMLHFSGYLVNQGFANISENYLIWGSIRYTYAYSKVSGKLFKLGIDEGFLDNGSYAGLIDKENNFWLVSSRGIYKARLCPFENIFVDKSEPFREVTAVEFFNDTEFFIGHEDGYSILKNGVAKLTKVFGKPESNRVLDAAKDNEGNVWLTSQFYGLGICSPDGKINWKHTSDYDYFSVVVDSLNNTWFSTERGLYTIKKNKTPELIFSSADMNFMRKIFKSAYGGLVICTNKGVGIYNYGKMKKIQSGSGYANNTYAYFDFYKNYRFVGTSGGLYIIEADSLRKFNASNLSIDLPVYFINNDFAGNLWFGLSNGVIKWDGKISTLYSVETGLAGIETNRSAGKPAGVNRFYIGTVNGLSIYNPAWENETSNAYPVKFLYLKDQAGSIYSLKEKVQLNQKNDPIDIYFTGYSYTNEKNNLFELTVINLKENKSVKYTSAKRNITLSGLSEGSYTLKLRIMDGLGNWSAYNVNNNLVINPSFLSGNYIIITGSIVFVIILLIIGYRFYFVKKTDLVEMPGKISMDFFTNISNIPELNRIHMVLKDKRYYEDASLDLNKFSDLVNIKPRTFSRILNENLGMNFYNFLSIYRIEDAKEKLKMNRYDDYSIEGISKLVGFKSKSSFHIAFKKFTGQTPNDFKKKIRPAVET